MARRLFSLLSLFVVVLGVFVVTSFPGVILGAGPFYEGKMVRIIVGYAAGGGYDLYARMIARHMGKHIPGNPTIIVENMTGAGSLIAANHIYRVAKPDGLTIGHFDGGLFFGQAFGRPGVEFDALKFEYLGTPRNDYVVLSLRKACAIKSIDELMASKALVRIGGTAPGTAMDMFPRTLRAALGLPIRVITGYKGTADMRLAIESGELDGVCYSWHSMKVYFRKALDMGDLIPILVAAPKVSPELPNLPLAINLAKTEEARQLIEVGVHTAITIAFTLAMPPGTPTERVQILREAFQKTFNDKEFLAEAEKAKIDVTPGTGEELEKKVAGLFKLSPALLTKLEEVFYK